MPTKKELEAENESLREENSRQQESIDNACRLLEESADRNTDLTRQVEHLTEESANLTNIIVTNLQGGFT